MIQLFIMDLFCLMSRYEFRKTEKNRRKMVKPTFKNNSVAGILGVSILFFRSNCYATVYFQINWKAKNEFQFSVT